MMKCIPFLRSAPQRSLTVAVAAMTMLLGAKTADVHDSSGPGGRLGIRLISTDQYNNAVKDVFGANVGGSIRLPPLRRSDGLLALGAARAAVSPGSLEYFQSAAVQVATQVVSEQQREVLIPCKPKNISMPDDGCARRFLSGVGRLLFRRPLDRVTLERYVALARETGKQGGDFYEGIRSALVGMLVAPEFIYLIERSEPDPSNRGAERLDGISKAMRLSLFFWDAPPDAELLRAADSGEIHTKAGLRRQLDRLVASPRLEAGIRAFFSDMLLAELFDDLTKDRTIYPAATAKSVTDAKEQMLRIAVDQLLTRKGDYRGLFTTRNIFLTRSLATLYRIPISVPTASDWVAYELPEGGSRAGILTQAGFLAVESHPGRSSPTKRGRAIREIFMCQQVPNPPPNVDFSALENPDPNNKTARQRLSAHNANPVCAGCHKMTDPMGLSLENFDGAGQFRTLEGGAFIDASGSLGASKFSDARGLGVALANDPAVPACVSRKLVQYGLGRTLTQQDDPWINYVQTSFSKNGYRFIDLMRTIALSEAFFKLNSDPIQVAGRDDKTKPRF